MHGRRSDAITTFEIRVGLSIGEVTTSDGDDVSARGIKDQIQKLVSGEDTKNPLTDQAIVEILLQTGVQIARRTVAKYRDQLGVLPARMRKRV